MNPVSYYELNELVILDLQTSDIDNKIVTKYILNGITKPFILF